MGFVVQPYKCLVWSPFNLPLNSFVFANFCYPLDGIKVSSILFGFASFISSIL
jgi:hypothetical protein